MGAVAENAVGSEDKFIGRQSHAPSEAETENQRDVRNLVDFLSKLNPSAKEFVPSSYTAWKFDGRLSAGAPIFVVASDYYSKGGIDHGGIRDSFSDGSSNNQLNRGRRNGYSQGWRRKTDRVRSAQSKESIRRTVYVSDIDHHVTEEKLAGIFATCGQVVDCRICGDPRWVRFAFIEFFDEDGARAALDLDFTKLGYYPVRVLPSKTAILPVNPKFLPRSEDEKEKVSRTVYCMNIDKEVTQTEVKVFFEQFCGFSFETSWRYAFNMYCFCRVCTGRKCCSSSELQWHDSRNTTNQGESFKNPGEATGNPSLIKLTWVR
ncbi:polyadenylate-binding protein-interacting protein 9 isoform X3 [Musa acuminata AAA Group]|uniref:polyadenylate-binding protein-interacting protein 9 isoform X3 n=1 Tax=Musa acuminata AAA Group TaxID=214697 RepID=UPI0031E2FAE3